LMKWIPSLALVFLLVWPTAAFASLININTADTVMLVTLKGIGEVKAQAIVHYRENRGPFRKTEDIMRVKGIGAVTFANIKDFITVGEVAPLPEPPKPAQPKPVTAKAPATLPQTNAAAVTQTDLSADVPYTAPESAPLWWYLAGLAALVGLGISGVWYARLSVPKAETKPTPQEFEIE
ncbi:MAG: helix-hairpin-helix domain-containing protein, partial [Patescibacteria group bacterium]